MNLISKKDLLAITGISYGQLYRWKRERLIPEEWFIKQSAYTGQETFFPREQIISRIKSILELKDLYSLEELAKILSPETSIATISLKDLEEVEEIDHNILSIMPELFFKDNYEFYEVALTVAISQVAKKTGITGPKAAQLLRKSASPALSKKTTDVTCTVFHTGSDYYTVFSHGPAALAFDSSIEVVEQLSLSEITDTIKLKYKNLFVK